MVLTGEPLKDSVITAMDFKGLLDFYEDHLRNQVMPFWLKHCIDWEKGGVFNLIEDDGTLVSTDKLMWSQARALWTFSALYNDFERKPDWLELAHNTANFILITAGTQTGPGRLG